MTSARRAARIHPYDEDDSARFEELRPREDDGDESDDTFDSRSAADLDRDASEAENAWRRAGNG